jgi:hypothetical protein
VEFHGFLSLRMLLLILMRISNPGSHGSPRQPTIQVRAPVVSLRFGIAGLALIRARVGDEMLSGSSMG